ncbi:MAG: multifunctional oxoglutarate decarboxylase/oxoglutarate dehydrogenase thiamine pyrophosphate-binding subunit/dihydrolipoyllysine-residue succinyltransferase subunit, partial [Acidimicrobiales bacterium]|nr:multifunctional oxoglutarate decarboxylase/oxoglutarate dehydrogenase thiamine pyrophosphate-binding subunit/dihydrolipoyllysine-residue succinyltransferase subunit [Acidimicrobiales bacterium]
MFERYRADASSVSESWQEFFADYGDERPSSVSAPPPMAAANPAPAPPAVAPAANGSNPAAAPTTSPNGSGAATPAAAATAPTPPSGPTEPAEPEGKPLRGAAARIVANMEASLDVPTATSFREIPARLLEVNRSVINGYLRRTRSGKVSYTHMLGYAVVRAIADTMPVMNSTFVDGDPPRVVRNDHIGMGLAVDVEKRDGSRTLLVPCIRDADTLDFRGFVDSYEELIRKVRSNKLSPDDFSGVTVSLTNPGTIGTVQSVPRLMPGQGLIVGVGNIDYPA